MLKGLCYVDDGNRELAALRGRWPSPLAGEVTLHAHDGAFAPKLVRILVKYSCL